jgi:hypothetical protein
MTVTNPAPTSPRGLQAASSLSSWLLRGLSAALAFTLLLAAGTGPAAARRGGGGNGDDDALKLRLNDAIGKPGGSVALVVRTYAARPIRQGRITVRVRAPLKSGIGFGVAELTQPSRPFTFVRAVVFSQRGDVGATTRVTGAGANQSLRVDFQSPSRTINAADGPLAVIYLRLAPGVTPGQRFVVEVDPAFTGLTGAAGQAIPIEPIEAELLVRSPSTPFAVEAEGDEVEPGEVAELGVETVEPFPVSGGRMTLRFDPAVRGGLPRVAIDPRYGRATFTVDRSLPGRLVVDFTSPDGTLNNVPGRIVAVDLPVIATAPLGESPVTLDPAASWLLARKGNRRLPIKLENGLLTVALDD